MVKRGCSEVNTLDQALDRGFAFSIRGMNEGPLFFTVHNFRGTMSDQERGRSSEMPGVFLRKRLVFRGTFILYISLASGDHRGIQLHSRHDVADFLELDSDSDFCCLFSSVLQIPTLSREDRERALD